MGSFCHTGVKISESEVIFSSMCNLVPRVCLFAGYVVSCHYITREQAYSGNEIDLCVKTVGDVSIALNELTCYLTVDI